MRRRGCVKSSCLTRRALTLSGLRNLVPVPMPGPFHQRLCGMRRLRKEQPRDPMRRRSGVAQPKMDMMIRILAAFVVSLALTLPATAQPIPGAETPAFGQARAAWLAGDDLSALQALAGMAREGNTAEQMLLSQIATATWTHGHVTGDMERRDRIALLRQEGGCRGATGCRRRARPMRVPRCSGRFGAGKAMHCHPYRC